MVCRLVVSTMKIHNSIQKKDVFIKSSIHVYLGRKYYSINRLKQYSNLFQDGGYKTKIIEHFLEIHRIISKLVGYTFSWSQKVLTMMKKILIPYPYN